MPKVIKVGKRASKIKLVTNGAPQMPRVARVGYELEKILAAHWIVPDPAAKNAHKGLIGKDGEGCKCLEHAREMDREGPDWCAENIEKIVGWMKDEAKRRGWKVFSHLYAKRLVKQAIQKAREATAAWEAKQKAKREPAPA